MDLRAVSARESLTPLVVLVPILATLMGAAWALTIFPPLALLVIAAGFTATAVAGHYTYGIRQSLVAASTGLLGALVAFPVWLALSYNSSICGKTVDSAWVWLPLAVGAVVFFGVGSFGFRTNRAGSVVPMALLFAIVALGAVYALVPGTPGYCD